MMPRLYSLISLKYGVKYTHQHSHYKYCRTDVLFDCTEGNWYD